MSLQAIDWVHKYSRSKGSARSVLTVLAHHMGRDGKGAFPSINTIAREAGVNRATVFRALDDLKELGELDWIAGGGRNRTNLYTLTLFVRQGALFSLEVGCDRFPGKNGRNDAAKQSHPSDTNKTEQKTRRASHADDPRREPFLNFARESFGTAHGGRLPTWAVKDYGQLARLLKCNPGLRIGELKRRWIDFLASSDSFIRNQGHSLGWFCSNFDRFIDGPIGRPPAGGQYGKNSRCNRGIAPAAGSYRGRVPDAEFTE